MATMQQERLRALTEAGHRLGDRHGAACVVVATIDPLRERADGEAQRERIGYAGVEAPDRRAGGTADLGEQVQRRGRALGQPREAVAAGRS